MTEFHDESGSPESDEKSVDIDVLRSAKPDTEYINRHGFEVTEAEIGRVVMAMPRREWMLNVYDNIAGGVLASLIDIASVPAILATLGDLPDQMETAELNVSYVRPASEGVEAEAEVVRIGDSLAITEVEVTGRAPDGERKVVATGRTTYRIGS